MGDMNMRMDRNPVPYFVRVLKGKVLAFERSEGLLNYPIAANGYPEPLDVDPPVGIDHPKPKDAIVLTFLPHEINDAHLPRYNEYEDPSTVKVIFQSLRNNNNSSEKQGPVAKLSSQEEAVIENPPNSSASVSGTKVETGEDPEEEPLLKRPRLALKPDDSST